MQRINDGIASESDVEGALEHLYFLVHSNQVPEVEANSYITLPFIFTVKISFGTNDYNPKIIIGLFVLIWTNDTFAYIVGKSIGKHKLFERISPKKTIEGFLGGAHDLDEIVERSARQLALLTNSLAMVQYPSLGKSTVRHIELIPIGTSRLLLMLSLRT